MNGSVQQLALETHRRWLCLLMNVNAREGRQTGCDWSLSDLDNHSVCVCVIQCVIQCVCVCVCETSIFICFHWLIFWIHSVFRKGRCLCFASATRTLFSGCIKVLTGSLFLCFLISFALSLEIVIDRSYMSHLTLIPQNALGAESSPWQPVYWPVHIHIQYTRTPTHTLCHSKCKCIY